MIPRKRKSLWNASFRSAATTIPEAIASSSGERDIRTDTADGVLHLQ
ncbi:MAG: hypothetical protein IRZ07_17015 [Microbispora sp.]|nr:hypothetical protein [Microbispora sp.]